jgi:hypothetical protein
MPAIASLGIDLARRAIRLQGVGVMRVGDALMVTGSVRPHSGRRPFASTWPPE